MYTKKLFQLVALLMIVSTAVFAQTKWTGGAGNTDWDNTLNWDGGVPDQFTDAQIDAGSTNPALTGAATCKNLIVSTSGVLYLNGTGANTSPGTLLVFGNVTINTGGTIQGGTGTLQLKGSWVRNGAFNGGTGSTIEFVGTTAQSLSATSFYNLKISGTGAVSLTGDLVIGSVLTIGAGATLSAGSNTINFTGTTTTPPFVPFVITGTFSAGTSTVAYKNTSTTTVAGGTGVSYNNLSINRTSFTFTPSAALTVAGVLSVDAGTFATGAFTHNIKGSLTVASGAIFTATAGSTLNFNGASAQQIPLVQYDWIKINNASGVTLFGSTGIATVAGIAIGDVQANSTFSDGGNQIFLSSGAATLTMSATATLKIGSSSAATTLPTFGTETLASGSTIEFASSVGQNVRASAAAGYQKLIFSGSGTKTVAASLVNGSFTVNSGVTLVISSPVTLNATSTLNNGGTISVTTTTGDGLLIAGTGSGATQNVGTLTGAGIVTFRPTAAQTVNLGTLTSTGTVNFDNAGNFINFVTGASASTFKTLNLLGNVTAAGTIVPTNDWTISSGGSLTLSSTAGISLNSGRTITLVGNLVSNATGSITNAGTISMTGTTLTLGIYSGTGTLTFNPATAATLTLLPVFSAVGGTVNIGGAGLIAFNASTPSSITNLNITNTGTSVTPAGNWQVLGTLAIGAGTTLNIGANTWSLYGNVTETGTGKLAGTGALQFFGSSSQTWTVGAARDYHQINATVGLAAGNLVITGGNVQINQLTFNGTAPNTNARINMSGNTLILTTAAFGGALANNHYIYNGTVSATVAAAYTFPLGDGTNYAPLSITTAQTQPGTTVVGYVAADPGGTSPSLLIASSGANTTTVSRASAYYWTFNPTVSLVNNTDLQITLARDPAVNDPFQLFSEARMVVRNLSTDAWTAMTGTYGNTQGTTNKDIASVVLNPGAGALSPGTKTLAYGLVSAVVNVSGLVYYGDLPRTTGNEVGSVTVSLTSASPVYNNTALIATGASTVGYSFGVTIAGITDNGYKGKVTAFPAWAGVTGTSSTDAVAVRNTIVGRTTGAITAAETMKWIAADVDNSAGTIVEPAGPTAATGGEVVFATTPASTWLNAVDVMQILQRAAGTITSFARGDFYSTTYTTSNRLLANQTNQTIRVIAIGDASYTTVPTALKKKSVLFANEGNLNVDAKKAFSVPVTMTSESVEAGAFTIAVKYPADKVEYKGVASSFEGISAVAKDGYVRISWIDMSTEKPAVIAKGSEIVNIKFQPKEGFNANTGFALELDAAHTSFSDNDAKALSLSIASPHVGAALPTEFSLSQNYPNPFNPATSLNYSVPEVGKVSVKIYNIIGEEVATLFNGVQEPGRYTATWNANNMASGVYIVRMTGSSTTKNFSQVVKIMLLK